MSDILVEKLFLTCLILNFVFGLVVFYCYEKRSDKRYYKLGKICLDLLPLNGVLFLLAMLLTVWMR